VRVLRLWLTDFRNYTEVEVEPAPDGLTAIVGANGEGKTNLLEAVGYLATLSSFRGAPGAALVREGCDSAIVRAEVERESREVLLEAQLAVTGRDRVLVNRQPLRRTRDLLGALRVSVFSPDDLVLVKGAPSGRREFLDDTVVALHAKHDALRSDVDRILRQRGALLKQAGGRLTAEIESTLDVWDAKLATAGQALVEARQETLAVIEPEVVKAYGQLAGTGAVVSLRYLQSWAGDLLAALAASRADDLRRAATLVGPHRDDVVLAIDGLPARTHASQGEQRSLALALRLAAHRAVADLTGTPPVLLLDDVFSELDPARSEALIAHIPDGQALVSTTGLLPSAARPDRVFVVRAGTVTAQDAS
jgi:DNA replication and repair protein RecF